MDQKGRPDSYRDGLFYLTQGLWVYIMIATGRQQIDK